MGNYEIVAHIHPRLKKREHCSVKSCQKIYRSVQKFFTRTKIDRLDTIKDSSVKSEVFFDRDEVTNTLCSVHSANDSMDSFLTCAHLPICCISHTTLACIWSKGISAFTVDTAQMKAHRTFIHICKDNNRVRERAQTVMCGNTAGKSITFYFMKTLVTKMSYFQQQWTKWNTHLATSHIRQLSNGSTCHKLREVYVPTLQQKSQKVCAIFGACEWCWALDMSAGSAVGGSERVELKSKIRYCWDHSIYSFLSSIWQMWTDSWIRREKHNAAPLGIEPGSSDCRSDTLTTVLRNHDTNCVQIFVFHQAVSSFSQRGDPNVGAYKHEETNENLLHLFITVQIENWFLLGPFHLIKQLTPFFFYLTNVNWQLDQTKKKTTTQRSPF